MNKLSVFAVSIFAGGILSAAPVVSGVTLTQDASRRATVKYRLTGDPAIITVDFLTNGVSIGESACRGLAGDCNKLVSPDAANDKTVVWHPDKTWPGHICDVVAVVKAWTKEDPPDYMTVNLRSGDIAYYVGTNSLPKGSATVDEYRTEWMLFRRIRAAGIPWTMGSAKTGTTETGRNANGYEDAHEVTLDHDYWFGVFEVTKRQWEILTGTARGSAGNMDGRLPVEWISRLQMRECDANTKNEVNASAIYPNNPYPTSFLGRLRELTGGMAFDLPWESEWEYAARAGHGNGFWGNGEAYVGPDTDAALDRFGNYGKKNGLMTVGSYAPNDWGIYDTAGNVTEACIDAALKDITSLGGAPYENASKAADSVFISRGGGFTDKASACRPAYRNCQPKNNQCHDAFGFRAMCRE